MTAYELARRLASPFLPVVYSHARRDIARLLGSTSVDRPSILDVGGRSSPYTVGLRARITLLDIPRQGEVPHQLNLGLTDEIQDRLRRRRSNVERFVLEDMTRCSLPSDSFDGVIAIETIEHVDDDDAFVEQIRRVLKPGGWAYLTTPNGDYIRNEPPDYNPDHRRHYRRRQLSQLLSRYFSEVRVVYGVRTGKHRYRGLRSIDLRRPWSALLTMASNVINRFESRGLSEQPVRTAHLFAETHN